jgi:penicillin-binding protein-related factor A (putative recombinase)
MIHIGQGFFLLDFEPKSIHHSKLILEKLIREHQHHNNYKANQTPSNLP